MADHCGVLLTEEISCDFNIDYTGISVISIGTLVQTHREGAIYSGAAWFVLVKPE